MATGIRIEGARDAGSLKIEYFAIVSEMAEAAAIELLAILGDASITLCNDDDEGGEGCTSIRKTSSGFEMMSGGHGWQSDWRPATESDVKAKIVELSPCNCGGHWSRQGSIQRPNAP